MVVNIDHALFLKLVDDVSCVLELLRHLVELGQFLLGCRQLLHLCLDVGFPVCLGLFSLLYFESGPASLRGGLQHIGRHALLD